jgi:hypothetical protein
MEMAGKQFSPFMETVVQLRLTDCATAPYGLWKWLASSSPRLWKRLCNHVLLLVQVCLTNCVTVSYGLWKWLASSSPVYGNGCATMSYYLCNCVLRFIGMVGKQFSLFMELLVQLCLTDCVTASYGLWKWLASSSPIYGNGFRSGTSKNQWLHKKLGNSKNRVTYRLR